MARPPQTGPLAPALHPDQLELVEPLERWFKELTDRRLRRGTFTSVAHLIDVIETWADHWNDDPKPFIWHKTAEEIIAKVRRGRAALAQVKWVRLRRSDVRAPLVTTWRAGRGRGLTV